LTQVLYRYDDAGDAKEVVAAYTDHVKRCKKWTVEAGEGQKIAGTYATLPFPELGDDTSAARKSSGGTPEVFVQKGNLVTSIRVRDVQAGPHSAQTLALVEKAVAEL